MVFVAIGPAGRSDLVILMSGFKTNFATYIKICLKPLLASPPPYQNNIPSGSCSSSSHKEDAAFSGRNFATIRLSSWNPSQLAGSKSTWLFPVAYIERETWQIRLSSKLRAALGDFAKRVGIHSPAGDPGQLRILAAPGSSGEAHKWLSYWLTLFQFLILRSFLYLLMYDRVAEYNR